MHNGISVLYRCYNLIRGCREDEKTPLHLMCHCEAYNSSRRYTGGRQAHPGGANDIAPEDDAGFYGKHRTSGEVGINAEDTIGKQGQQYRNLQGDHLQRNNNKN